MDFYSASGMSILWVCFFQTIAISWIFGAKKFCDCIHQMMGVRLNKFWYICWVVFAPVIMAVSIGRFTRNFLVFKMRDNEREIGILKRGSDLFKQNIDLGTEINVRREK